MDSSDLDALEQQARTTLPPASWAFLATGADDQVSVAENVAAWRALRLRPHVLNDIVDVDTSVTVLDARIDAPILVAPTGRHKLFHAEGERATARGATAANALYVMAHSANITVEQVAAERRHAPQWFQLYLHPDHGEIEKLIDRVAAAGFSAIALTVDSQTYGWSPMASRAPYTPTPDIRSVNFPGQPVMRHGYDPALKGKVQFPTTWRDLQWLVKRSPLPIVVKGILRADDAVRCAETGARAVIVSNHGGRHLDTTVTTADALPEIAAALKGKAEVYVDSGIRRGSDIVKALALGARAVLIGRPVLWGLSVHGAEGVSAVIHHLRDDLVRTMRLCGLNSLRDVPADLLARWAGGRQV